MKVGDTIIEHYGTLELKDAWIVHRAAPGIVRLDVEVDAVIGVKREVYGDRNIGFIYVASVTGHKVGFDYLRLPDLDRKAVANGFNSIAIVLPSELHASRLYMLSMFLRQTRVGFFTDFDEAERYVRKAQERDGPGPSDLDPKDAPHHQAHEEGERGNPQGDAGHLQEPLLERQVLGHG